MKKISYIMFAFVVALATSGCNFEFQPSESYSDKTFWYSATNAKTGLTGCYLPLRNNTLYGGNAISNEETASPNAYNYGNHMGWNDIAKGTHTADGSTIISSRWKDAYVGIGRCNMLLANIDVNKELTAEEIVQMKAQARFLRALYYGILTTYYYSAPLVTDSPDISQVASSRTDRERILSFVVNELNDVATILPRKYSSASDQGRATAGAALALKARLLTFEASPLTNPDNDPQKWEAAASANLEVMNMGIYSLYSDYKKLFTEEAEHSTESIFNLEALANPTGMGHSIDIVQRQYNICAPLKGFVESYWMEDGKPRGESAFSQAGDYENLDPRFYKTVVYPGSTWMGQVVTGNDSGPFTNVQTGYLFGKYTVYTEAAATTAERSITDFGSPINIMILRYADILLMYAEAMNELGKLDEDVWNRTVRLVRRRAGFSDASAIAYPGTDRELLRKYIRYERMAEFAGEGMYYNDLRRWKEAEKVMDNLTIRKFDDTGIMTRTFNKNRDYWWPVPSVETELAPELLPNNPGW